MSPARLRGAAALLFPAAALLAPDAQAAVFYVGAGASCTHATIQAAIDAAAASPGYDAIVVTRSRTHTGLALKIANQDLALIGGYPQCNSPGPDDQNTSLSGDGGAEDSVVQIRGTGNVNLVNLTIGGGDETDNGYGGGVDIAGGPHEVYLGNVWVMYNRAGYGGGVSVLGSSSVLRFGPNVDIETNEAGEDGGGVFCRDARFEMRMYTSTINGNTAASDGGGLRAENCTVEIASGGGGVPYWNDTTPAIAENTAGSGGGISVTGERARVALFTIDAARPVRITKNHARGKGGAIAIGSSARVDAWNAILDENSSNGDGAAFSIYDSDGNSADNAKFAMFSDVSGAPMGAVRCQPALRCNRIANNIGYSSSRMNPDRAIVHGLSQTNYNESWNGRGTEIRLAHTTLERNSGSHVFWLGSPSSGRSRLELDNVAVISNTARSAIVANSATIVGIRDTTIGGTGGSDGVLRVDGPLALQHSIVWPEGAVPVLVRPGGLSGVQASYVMAHNTSTLPASTTIMAGYPKFVDRANGNWRLMSDSPAADFAPVPAWPQPMDAGGAARHVELRFNANEFGARDLGAYEVPPDTVVFDPGIGFGG